MAESVSKDTCDICRDNFQRQLDTDERRLNDHSQSIDGLREISLKLTNIVENHEERFDKIEEGVVLANTTLKKYIETTENNKKESYKLWVQPLVLVIVSAVIGFYGKSIISGLAKFLLNSK